MVRVAIAFICASFGFVPSVSAEVFHRTRFAVLGPGADVDAAEIVAAISSAGLGPVRAIQRLPESGWLLERPEGAVWGDYLSAIADLDVGFPAPLSKAAIPGYWKTTRPSLLVRGARGASSSEIESLLSAYGIVVPNHAGVERLWRLDPGARTGVDLLDVITLLEAEPLVESARPRPLLVVPAGWPRLWFYWYFDQPIVLTPAADSFYLWDVVLQEEELLELLSELGEGTFERAHGFNGRFFVCFPTGSEGGRRNLPALFERLVDLGVGVPSPTFDFGLHRLYYEDSGIVKFQPGLSAMEKVSLLELIGEVEDLDWLGYGRVAVHARTGVDPLQGINLLHLHSDVQWAELSMTIFGPGPSDDPTSPQITPCELP